MADQALIPAQPQTPSFARCSPGLRKLLVEGDDAGAACRLLALNAKLRDEARELQPAIEHELEPAARTDLLPLLIRQAIVFGVPDRRPEAWAELLDVYLQALEGFSVAAVEDGFARWNRGELYPAQPQRHAFFPKPAELVTMAAPHKRDLQMARYRVRKALEHVAKTGHAWTPERKAAERQKMIEMGLLTADGKPNFQIAGKTIPGELRPTRTPQQVAEQLRAAASNEAPKTDTPAADDIGDVI